MIEQSITDLTAAVNRLTAAIIAARNPAAPDSGLASNIAAGATAAANKATAARRPAHPVAADKAPAAASNKATAAADKAPAARPAAAAEAKTTKAPESAAAQPHRVETEQAAAQAKPAETEQGAKQIDMEKVRELTRKVSQADDDAKQALRKMVISSGVKKLGDMPAPAMAQFVARLVELAGRLGIQSEL